MLVYVGSHVNVHTYFLFNSQGAVSFLNKYGLEDGKYLIRSSIKCHGYYVLSVGLGGKVYHFQIKSRVSVDEPPL